jgi:GDP-4-dehydro-6-deoxy-D-mannose reductase
MSAPGRILLTGAGGFVGTHLQPALAVAFPNAVLLADWFDLGDSEAAAAAVAAGRPDVCVHLAAISTLAVARRDQDRC